MSNYVNDALLDASPYKKQQEEAKSLVNKWDKTGLLDGLNEEFQKNGMAVMLENQAKQLINENSGTGGSTGGSSAAGSEEWSGVALPLVRRIFGEIAAQDFVSVQPMNLPSGLVFYLDFKYGTTTGGNQGVGYGTNLGAEVAGGDVNSLGGKTGPNSPSGSSAPFGVGGLYGQGRYDYSINQVESGILTDNGPISGDAATTKYESGSVTYKDINFNQDFSASLAAGELVKLNVLTSDLTNADLKAVRSYGISASAGIVELLPQFTKEDGNNLSFIVSGSSVAGVGGPEQHIKVLFTKQPTESDRGDFEDTSGDATSDT